MSERPSVRRGLDALIDHGVLAMSGEDIGFTAKGRMLLAYVQQARGQAPSAYEHDDDSPAELASLLRAIEQDERFDPYTSLEEVETLPARLEAERRRAQKKASSSSSKWILALLLIIGVAVYFYSRHF
ncbi:hypothetical protein QTI66_10100 [Variovorax sp. J22R133]|uniref:hypothetical protein n=1 Tax=Variovorax brevis TaxID=3053503 RepID=UPI0025760C9F|nr:hypothetical protein [Variovorax sp. J22R133]MDM0112503.1 hypothetical protein [Variovorax sp. J22R133]